jgi:hypothetical protein
MTSALHAIKIFHIQKSANRKCIPSTVPEYSLQKPNTVPHSDRAKTNSMKQKATILKPRENFILYTVPEFRSSSGIQTSEAEYGEIQYCLPKPNTERASPISGNERFQSIRNNRFTPVGREQLVPLQYRMRGPPRRPNPFLISPLSLFLRFKP